MKSGIIKLAFVLVVLSGLASCQINEPSTAPDYTSTGRVMFEFSDRNISFYSNLFDKLLRMNSYIQAADSDKQSVEDSYFENFKIRTKDNKTWYLINSGDTIYTINSDNKPFSSVGSKFSIKRMYCNPVTFENTGNNQWNLKAMNISLQDSIVATDLNFTCTNSSSPKSFESADFEIAGNTKFVVDQYNTRIIFLCNITKSFKHPKDEYFCVYNNGTCTLTAFDISTLEEGSAQAEFEKLTADTKKLKVVYSGRTNQYTQDYRIYDFDTDNGYYNFIY
jgi:hypothetical protein